MAQERVCEETPLQTSSGAEVEELTALHHEVASLAESFGLDLPESLHEQLETVEHQVEHVLELSEVFQQEAETESSSHVVASGSPGAASGRKCSTAEAAAERIVQKLMLRSTELEAPVVLARVLAGGCSIECPATNFGDVRAAAITGVPLAYCTPPLADTPLLAARSAGFQGHIAVAYRGGVPVSTKAQHVQDAGAAGLVLINSDDHAWVPCVKTADEKLAASKINIPIVIVPKSTEAILSAGALATLQVRQLEPIKQTAGIATSSAERQALHQEQTQEPSTEPMMRTAAEVRFQPDLSGHSARLISDDIDAQKKRQAPINAQYHRTASEPLMQDSMLGLPPQPGSPISILHATAVAAAAAVAAEASAPEQLPFATSTSAGSSNQISGQREEVGVHTGICAVISNAELNERQEQPNQGARANLAEAASVGAMLQSSTVTLEVRCQRLLMKVQLLEDENSHLHQQMVQQRQQHEQERDSLVAEVGQWMSASNRAAEQLEKVNKTLEEATAAAAAAPPAAPAPPPAPPAAPAPPAPATSAPAKLVPQPIAAAPPPPAPLPARETGESLTLQLVPAPKPEDIPISESHVPSTESMAKELQPLLGCKPATSHRQIFTDGGVTTSPPASVKTAKKPRTMSVAEEQHLGPHERQMMIQTFSTGHHPSTASKNDLSRDDERASSRTAQSEAEDSDPGDRNALPPSDKRAGETEPARSDDNEEEVDQGLAAVAAQMQALEEFQAQAMAGLHRLHEMKMQEDTGACEHNAIPPAPEPAAIVIQDAASLSKTCFVPEHEQSPCNESKRSTPFVQERAETAAAREQVEEQVEDQPLDESSVEELLALQAQAQAMMEAMETLQAAMDTSTPPDSPHQPGDVHSDKDKAVNRCDTSNEDSVSSPLAAHGAPDDLLPRLPVAPCSGDGVVPHAASNGTSAPPETTDGFAVSKEITKPHSPPGAGERSSSINDDDTDCNDAFRRFAMQKGDLEAIDATIAASMAALEQYAALAEG
eukprot:COSAG02_NODE_5731_length_4083_cov_2.935492_2_plen_1000_part_00